MTELYVHEIRSLWSLHYEGTQEAICFSNDLQKNRNMDLRKVIVWDIN